MVTIEMNSTRTIYPMYGGRMFNPITLCAQGSLLAIADQK